MRFSSGESSSPRADTCVFSRIPVAFNSTLSRRPASRLLGEAINGSPPKSRASGICTSLMSTIQATISRCDQPALFAGVASHPKHWSDDGNPHRRSWSKMSPHAHALHTWIKLLFCPSFCGRQRQYCKESPAARSSATRTRRQYYLSSGKDGGGLAC